MSNYRVIVTIVITFGTILGGIFVPILASSQPPYARLDKFGVKEMYPTKPGGREWYINMDNPKNDGMFTIESHQNITRQNDSSWHIAYQKVRMSVNTPLNAPMWKNVEITG